MNLTTAHPKMTCATWEPARSPRPLRTRQRPAIPQRPASFARFLRDEGGATEQRAKLASSARRPAAAATAYAVPDYRGTTWTAGTPWRVARTLPVPSPYGHRAHVAQPRVMTPPLATLRAATLGHTRRLPSGLPTRPVQLAPYPRPCSSRPHASPASLRATQPNPYPFLARCRPTGNRKPPSPGSSPSRK